MWTDLPEANYCNKWITAPGRELESYVDEAEAAKAPSNSSPSPNSGPNPVPESNPSPSPDPNLNPNQAPDFDPTFTDAPSGRGQASRDADREAYRADEKALAILTLLLILEP